MTAGTTLPGESPAGQDVTREGTVIGTVPYMSPEQVEGREMDVRSNIFSLGMVLYEMVTGTRAFFGKSDFSVASAILVKEPQAIGELQPLTPPALERTIRVCLAKQPDERWQSAGDLWKELRWIAEGSSQTGVSSLNTPRRVRRSRLSGMFAALFAAIAAASLLFAAYSTRHPESFSFRQLNFRREAIFQAAFGPDKATVFYSVATSGNTPQIFMVGPEYPEPQAIGTRGMQLLAVSSKGELAVLLNSRYVWYRLFTGTLARMPLGGGAPREVQEGVRQADWSPDGSQLAIIREVGGKDRQEYPIGNVLREVTGYMSDLRFSPQGDRIAYFEHPRQWDDRGSVNFVDLAGKNTDLSEGYWSERGLAWSPNGQEVLFSASQSGGSFMVYAVTPAGKRRIAFQARGGMTIQDIARDGRWLTTRLDYRYEAMVHTPGDTEDRDLSWLNTSHARALSQDGKTLLFAETALSTNYAVCLRKTDGSPVVRLGEGWPADLSPDGKWALAVVQSNPPKLVVYPTGAGDTLKLERGKIETYVSAQWFRDGKRVLINGNEPAKGTRFYVQGIGGPAATAVTPEGTRDDWLSQDGMQILARGPDRRYSIYPVAGGSPQPVAGLAEADLLAQWSADQRSVLAYHRGEVPCRLDRVDLATGHRTLFKEFAPTGRTGLLSMRGILLTDDHRFYAYTAYYQVSSLFVSDPKP